MGRMKNNGTKGLPDTEERTKKKEIINIRMLCREENNTRNIGKMDIIKKNVAKRKIAFIKMLKKEANERKYVKKMKITKQIKRRVGRGFLGEESCILRLGRNMYVSRRVGGEEMALLGRYSYKRKGVALVGSAGIAVI